MEGLVSSSLKRTLDLFAANNTTAWTNNPDLDGKRLKIKAKLQAEYNDVKETAPPPTILQQFYSKETKPTTQVTIEEGEEDVKPPSAAIDADDLDDDLAKTTAQIIPQAKAEIAQKQPTNALALRNISTGYESSSRTIIPVERIHYEKPEWHAPWKLMRVISGHVGWVRSVAVDPSNEWFITGSADKTIKVWDLASGTLKLTLTGHIAAVRALAISPRHPYMFSAGEDRQVRCWDLEVNKTIRHYHGHLNAIYCMSLHPTLDVLITGGRDSVARVWDMRTCKEIFTLVGHGNTIADIKTQATDPQVITGSHDTTVRLWDLAAGKSMITLTHHKKSIRSLVLHPREYTFATGGADNIKKWLLPEAKFLHNMSGHNAVINTMDVNSEGVMISCADNGSMCCWDWKTGYKFQNIQTQVQPGSLESEAGVLASSFDYSGSRFITCEVDKTIKVWKEDEDATPETHPIGEDWKLVQQNQKRW